VCIIQIRQITTIVRFSHYVVKNSREIILELSVQPTHCWMTEKCMSPSVAGGSVGVAHSYENSIWEEGAAINCNQMSDSNVLEEYYILGHNAA
jgi:hypothetical protein